MTREEAKRLYHLDGEFSFVVETDGFTSFGDSYQRTHRHQPHQRGLPLRPRRPTVISRKKEIQPVFVAKGPDFRENVLLKEARLIDEAPTLAKLLGVPLEGADGKALDELLKSE